MSDELVSVVKQLWADGVAAVDPRRLVYDNFSLDRRDGLQIAGNRYSIPSSGVHLIAIGKCAYDMAAAAEDVLGNVFDGGIVVTKHLPEDAALASAMYEGSHPVPDERSISAGEQLLLFAGLIPEDALALCLISGGGSALVEALQTDVSLEELRRVTRELLDAGATIHELNAVRARMSRIKAGGLLRAIPTANVVNLVISDVLGDDLRTIASGPTTPSGGGMDAEDVLQRYGVSSGLPPAHAGTDGAAARSVVLANVWTAADAVAESAISLELPPVIVTTSVDGEASVIGRLFAGVVMDAAVGYTRFGWDVERSHHPTCIIAGGETTVTVRGDGVGGRNTEAALSAALRLEGVPGVALGFLATDGDDGETGAAGAIVTGETIHDGNRLAARDALARNDSWTFLSEVGATYEPGPTGTNVNDLIIGIVEWTD